MGPFRRRLLARLVRDRLSLWGAAIVLTFTLLAVFADTVAKDPVEMDPARRLLPPGPGHPLGTDALGRDLWSRIVHGSRWSLGLAAVATILIAALGITLGTLAGYLGGWIDAVLMRTVDVLLAFPGLLLAFAIVGVVGPGLENALLAVVALGWADYARIVRGATLGVREREFVLAARALGASDLRVLTSHVLPNVIPIVAVLATLEMGQLILAFASLGFLGLGVKPPTPEWGSMINEGRISFFVAPWPVICPGLAIGLAVLGFNLLGDGLRDALDPRRLTG